MGKPKGNAAGWTPEDAKKDAAQVQAAAVPAGYVLSGQHSYGSNKARAETIAKALRNAATQEEEGAAVTVENTGRYRPEWTVKVWRKR